MGFRNPISSAVDDVARQAAADAQAAAEAAGIPQQTLATAASGPRVVVEQTPLVGGFTTGAVRFYGADELTPSELLVDSYSEATGKKFVAWHAGDAADLTGTRPGISFGVQDAAAGGDEAVLWLCADRAGVINGEGDLAPLLVGWPSDPGHATPLSVIDARGLYGRVGWFGMETYTEPGWNEGSEGGNGARINGVFSFQGGFVKGSGWAAGELMATLHAEHRPSKTHTFSAVIGTGTLTTVKVYASGSIRVTAANAAAGTVTWSGSWPIG